MHLFTVQQVEKVKCDCGERSNVIVIDQIITHHNKIQSCACTKKCPFKGNLPPENALVHSAARGERSNMIVIDQTSTHHNKIQSRACTKKCPFQGNLPTGNALVHSVARGKRLNVIVIDQIYYSSQ